MLRQFHLTYKIANIHNIILHGMSTIDREPQGHLFLLSLAPKDLLLSRAFGFLRWLKIRRENPFDNYHCCANTCKIIQRWTVHKSDSIDSISR